MSGHSGKVSVIIPTYNRSDVLDSAIDSALFQTYDDIEVIVVDDGSTDDTSALIEQYGDDVCYYQFDENRGANAARNAGIELATGEFVAFLDADDEWKEEKIERQVRVLRQRGRGCGLVHTGIERRDTTGEAIDKRIPPEPNEPGRRLLLGNFVGTFSCILVRAEIFETIGTLDESLPSWQDWEFYLRVADQFNFALVPEPLTVKRVGQEDQISWNIDPLLNKTYPIFQSIISKRAVQHGRLFRRRALAMLNKEVGDSALMNDRADIARKFLFRGVQLYPLDLKLLGYCLLSIGGVRFYREVTELKKDLQDLS